MIRLKSIASRIYLIFLFLFFSINSNAEIFSGKVIKVLDGDTIHVLCPDYTKAIVRLSGIDSPEHLQAHSQSSKKYLSSLILSKKVKVEYTKVDPYGRIIGKIYYQQKDINLEMLNAGYAWHYKRYQYEQSIYDRQLYSQAEIKAQKSRLGIFQDSQPTPPWLWRHRKK